MDLINCDFERFARHLGFTVQEAKEIIDIMRSFYGAGYGFKPKSKISPTTENFIYDWESSWWRAGDWQGIYEQFYDDFCDDFPDKYENIDALKDTVEKWIKEKNYIFTLSTGMIIVGG